MKSIIKSIRKKQNVSEQKGSASYGAGKDAGKAGTAAGAAAAANEKEKLSHINAKELPKCRNDRSVTRKVLVQLPSLRDASPSTKSKLFIRKVRLCCYIFDFSDTPDSPQEAKDKETKRSTLLELVNYITVSKPVFTEDDLEEIFEMISRNLFRPLPPSTLEVMGMYNPEEDEPMNEPTWPHLQVVYEFLLRLATSTETDSKSLAKFFNRSFVLNLLALFNSEDSRERDYLKTILHRVYGNFMSLRPFVRRAINNVFYGFIYETDRHNGIAELLEILGSIINGFALPIKEQHKQFLQQVLLPLHKTSYVSIFHPQLSYCVTQFLEKDATLAPKIVAAILKYWPVTNNKKSLMFLNEVEEILDRVQAHHLGEMLVPLFTQIGRSINSPHFQVSERAIYVLNNDVILRFVTNNRASLVPPLAHALAKNTHLQSEGGGDEIVDEEWKLHQKWQEKGHWNSTIVELTQDIMKVFSEMDENLVYQCTQNHVSECKTKTESLMERAEVWDKLATKYKFTPVPFLLGVKESVFDSGGEVSTEKEESDA